MPEKTSKMPAGIFSGEKRYSYHRSKGLRYSYKIYSGFCTGLSGRNTENRSATIGHGQRKCLSSLYLESGERGKECDKDGKEPEVVPRGEAEKVIPSRVQKYTWEADPESLRRRLRLESRKAHQHTGMAPGENEVLVWGTFLR